MSNMKTRKVILITLDTDNVGDEQNTGADEALFDFGLPNPNLPSDSDEPWPNESGIWYNVVSVEVF